MPPECSGDGRNCFQPAAKHKYFDNVVAGDPMKWKPYITLVLLGIGCSLAAAGLWQARGAIGNWQYVGYAGISLILVTSATLCWEAGLLGTGPFAGKEGDYHRHEIAELRRKLDNQRELLQQELHEEFQRLDKRQRQLADRLIAFHQWNEFPEPIDLAEPHGRDERTADLAEKDRRMLALLQRESERLFQDIRRNKYVVNGKFDGSIARADVYRLVRDVAAIYQGENIENPLLQTSMAQILQSASRACLHFLVILEQMPVRVQDYSIDRLYGYIRQGVKAYEMYKVAEPYWNNWIKPGFFVGRLALGADPLILGAWWFVGALSSQGATALTTRIVNREALALLHSIVRVIGFEVASIYGGQFRYRDANWIYAAELTEMLHCFSTSRDSLLHAMREIGALQLRNEYDRIHFYRCLVEHDSAGPQRIAAAECLTIDQRQAVAHRLERFFLRFIKDRTPSRLRRWHAGVESRLQVSLILDEQEPQVSATEQSGRAVESLAGFLLAVKQVEPAEVPGLLRHCRLFQEYSAEQQRNLLADWQRQPPLSFEPPELPKDSTVARKFLGDLARLAASVPPRDPEVDALVRHAAAYVGCDEAEMQKILDSHYRQQLAARLSSDMRHLRPPADVARAVLDLLEEGESVRLLYGGVGVETVPPRSPEKATLPQGLWLLGAGDRLIAFSVEDTPRLIWRGDANVTLDRARTLVGQDCRIHGGQWMEPLRIEADEVATLRVPGRFHRRFQSFYAPLLRFCGADEEER